MFDQFQKRFLTREAGPFTAIDFTARTLHFAHARHHGGKVSLRAVESFELPAGMDINNAEAFGAYVGEKLRASKFRSSAIVLGIPRSQAILKPLVLPQVNSEAELAGMVMFQLEKELPFPADQAVADFAVGSHYDVDPSPRTPDNQSVEILVAAVKKPIIDACVALAAAAKVKLLSIGLRPQGHAACILKSTLAPKDACYALVHLTPSDVEIDVIANGALVMSRAATIKLPPPASVAADAASGPILPPAPSFPNLQTQSPNSPIDSLTGEVARTLRSYQAMQRDRAITHVLITGDTGLESSLTSTLAKRLGVAVTIFEPDASLGLGDQAAPASGATPAIGLALTFRDAQAMPFDFLHPKRPPVQRDEKKTKALIYSGAGIAAVLFFAILITSILNARQARIDDLKSQYAQLTVDNKRVAALAKRIKAIESWQGDKLNWLDQWAMLSASFPSPVDVYLTNLRVNADNSLSFTVKARNGQVITDLGKRLTEAGYDYRPGPVTTHEDKLGYTQTADVRLAVTPRVKIDLATLKVMNRPADDASLENLKGRKDWASFSVGLPGSNTSSASAPPPSVTPPLNNAPPPPGSAAPERRHRHRAAQPPEAH